MMALIEQNLCGDWTAYKDEKCVKIADTSGTQTQEDGEVVCQAFASDLPNGAKPKLLTIKTKEEQEFMQQFLFVEKEMIDNVWLGLSKKDNSSSFEWNDETAVSFSNWANQTVSDDQHQCVHIESGDGLVTAGLWLRVNCKRRNAVVCERRPMWTMEILQSALLNFRLEYEIKQKEWEQKYVKLEQETTVPVGLIYVQLPDQPPPTSLWPTMQWMDVSSNYSGLFFRVVGGNAAPFGEVQEGKTTCLEEVHAQRVAQNTPDSTTIPLDGSWSGFVDSGGPAGNNNNRLKFRLSTSEIRPTNQAVKIWKRLK